MKLIPAPELLGAVRPHRHDYQFHHEHAGLRYHLCRVCGHVYCVRVRAAWTL